MELGSNNNNSTVVKTPEVSEIETTPATRHHPSKPSPFSNGVLKRHVPLHLHHSHHPVVVTYRECLKNHAATIGGHAVDGCGEFMPSPASNPSEPTSLKCAACGCHRNFHRRDPDSSTSPAAFLLPPPTNSAVEFQPHHRHHPPPPPHSPPRGNSPDNSPSPPPISSSYYPSAPHMLLALSHGGMPVTPKDKNNSDPNLLINAASTTPQQQLNSSSSRKRYRTKFTSYQKDKMLEFAEKVGWKMQKKDEDLINGFCNEIGVDKGVFKVWMHNNKNTFGKKDNSNDNNLLMHLSNSSTTTALSTPPPPAAANGSYAAGGYHHQRDGDSDNNKPNAHLGANGGSSSSS